MLAALTPPLTASLVMSAIVAMVMMATLVAGPFHLSQALGLDLARVGIVMSAGPLVAALAGVPAGRLVDRFGAQRMVKAGLVGLAIASLALCAAPLSLGIAGYAVPLVVLTANYSLFQAANNTSVMKAVEAGERGLTSGMLNLSRNLGLIAGASAMGSLFAATGLRVTFAAGSALLLLALGLTAFRPAGKGV